MPVMRLIMYVCMYTASLCMYVCQNCMMQTQHSPEMGQKYSIRYAKGIYARIASNYECMYVCIQQVYLCMYVCMSELHGANTTQS